MSDPSPLSLALELATQGFAVFPVGRDKAPRCSRGHLSATTEPERISAMAARFGFVLIGVATGLASDAAALDIDRQHGGGEWWLSNRHRLPNTRAHRTRSGGLHLWFRHRPGLRCSTAKIAPGVDIRAEGGSCIWWPASNLPVLNDAPLAPWPEWLVPPPPAPPPHHTNGARPAPHAEAALAGLARTVASTAPGTRNGVLFWASCRAVEMVSSGEVERSFAEAVLIEAAGRAGLDKREAAAAFRSAARGGWA